MKAVTHNKIAIVTGASTGIGRAIAIAPGKEGAVVTLTKGKPKM